MSQQELVSFFSLIEIVQAVEDHIELVYVRYSEGPDADRRRVSRDFEANVDLPGLSVSVLTPEPWWQRPAADWIARRLCKYLDLAREPGRRPWLLTGRQVGNGTDHEPLVADPDPLGWVTDSAVQEARRHYTVAFEGNGPEGK